MSEREDYAEPDPDGPSPPVILAAIGRAFLFAVACWVLCLIVVELGFGHNMYFASDRDWIVSCHAPAGLAGLLHLGFTVRRWLKAPPVSTNDNYTERAVGADPRPPVGD